MSIFQQTHIVLTFSDRSSEQCGGLRRRLSVSVWLHQQVAVQHRLRRLERQLGQLCVELQLLLQAAADALVLAQQCLCAKHRCCYFSLFFSRWCVATGGRTAGWKIRKVARMFTYLGTW